MVFRRTANPFKRTIKELLFFWKKLKINVGVLLYSFPNVPQMNEVDVLQTSCL